MPNKNNAHKNPSTLATKPAHTGISDHQAVTNLPPVGMTEPVAETHNNLKTSSKQISVETPKSSLGQMHNPELIPVQKLSTGIQIEQIAPLVPRDLDRVRAFSDPAINALIDQGIRERLTMYAGQSHGLISKRITELEQEWDIGRFMAVKATSLSFIGLVLGFVRARRWMLLPLLALPMFIQHATTGTCLTTPLARRMGFRTRHEIEVEKYALKVLRGDFGDLDADVATSVKLALEAVKR